MIIEIMKKIIQVERLKKGYFHLSFRNNLNLRLVVIMVIHFTVKFKKK